MTDVIVPLSMVLLFAALNTAQPYLTRPELFFAVTVTADFRETLEARRIIRLYNIIGWAGALIAIALLFSNAVPTWVAVLPVLVGWIDAYIVARRRAQPHRTEPTSVRETLLAAGPERFPGGWLAAIGPFAILAAKTVYVYLHWDSIPARFPVHWSMSGPDRWVDRSAGSVYGALLFVAATTAVLVLSAFATIRASRRIAVTGAAADSEKTYRCVSAMCLLALAYASAILLPRIEGGTPPIPFTPVIFLLISAVYIALLIRFGQGGTRISGYHAVLGAPPVGDRTPDECWKLGMFYYNPEDPAVLVEKRFGIGWTLNFGSRWTWVIVPLLFLPLVIRIFTK